MTKEYSNEELNIDSKEAARRIFDLEAQRIFEIEVRRIFDLEARVDALEGRDVSPSNDPEWEDFDEAVDLPSDPVTEEVAERVKNIRAALGETDEAIPQAPTPAPGSTGAAPVEDAGTSGEAASADVSTGESGSVGAVQSEPVVQPAPAPVIRDILDLPSSPRQG